MNPLPDLSYAPYVWSAFAVFLAVFAWDVLAPWLRLRRLRREIVLRARRQAARQTVTSSGNLP